MDTDVFLETVRSSGPLGSDENVREAVEATMETLGERITDGQADDLANGLPDVAAEPLLDASPGEAEEFSTAVFLDRVAERASVDAEPVETARSVLIAVREAGADAELERTREQLPDQFALLFEPGRPMNEDEFLEAVDERLPDGIDPRDATAAILETLGERIAGGQAGDLATYLSRGVRSSLSAVDEDAVEFDRETFLETVGHRADVGDADPLDVARAVVDALEQTAAESELENVRTQLPPEFDPIFESA